MLNLAAVEREAAKAPFPFVGPDGTNYRLPHVADLTIGQQMDADANQLVRLFREVLEVEDGKGGWKPAGRAGTDLARGLHREHAATLKVAWLAWAGLKPGESQASSAS